MMAGQRAEGGVPAVGAGLEVEDYLEFLGKEYLAGFIRQGGAAVKVVVAGDDDVAARFHAGLAADAAAEGFVYAAVDAAATRAHLADQLFFAVAGQVDWAALALLRRSLIYGRIGRHSAQAMLTSLASWLPRVGHGGLVLDIDLARLAVGRRPPVEQREGVYYSKAAVLDAYEVLRQLIDATDVLSAAMVVVVVPPELLTDEVRGLPAYSALHLRVADEVRDRRRPNPYAGLVRLETRMEAVAVR